MSLGHILRYAQRQNHVVCKGETRAMERADFGEGTCQSVGLDGWEEGISAQEAH